MKHGVSCTFLKQNSSFLNGNHYNHFEAKNFDSTGVMGKLCWIFFYFFL